MSIRIVEFCDSHCIRVFLCGATLTCFPATQESSSVARVLRMTSHVQPDDMILAIGFFMIFLGPSPSLSQGTKAGDVFLGVRATEENQGLPIA